MSRRKRQQRPHRRRFPRKSSETGTFKAGRGTTPKFTRTHLNRYRAITHKQFTHSDFDRDKIPNLDDTYPFDPKRKQPIDKDSRFTEEFDKIEKFSLQHDVPRIRTQSTLRKLLKEDKDVHVLSRLKSTPSIINKLNRQHLHKIEDSAGILIEADNKLALTKAVAKIKKSDLNITNVEDFYSPKNKRPYYKSIHFDVIHKNKPVELQVKTIRQRVLHGKMHKGHKSGRDTGSFTVQQAINRANVAEFRDTTPPHSKRKLKRLPNLNSKPGSSDYEEP